jgi:hypothetical protein
VQQIVAEGPRAIPALLAALDSREPTAIRIGKGNLRLYRDRVRHVASDRERQALEAVFALGSAASPLAGPRVSDIEFEHLAVGDACFEILGAITNRRYSVFSYQPTGAARVCSPALDGDIARYLRRVWDEQQAAGGLLSWLEADARNRDDWDLSAGATLRLLRFYPTEALEPFRLFLRDARKLSDGDARLRERLAVVLRHAAESSDPRVREAVCAFAERENDHALLLASLCRACIDSDDGRARFGAKIEASMRGTVPAWSNSDVDEALSLVVEVFPDSAHSFVSAYLAAHSQRRSLQLLHRAISADPARGWVACALLQLLDDSTWFEENGDGVRASQLQVRHVAAAKLHEVLGLGAVDATSLLVPARIDDLVGRLRRIARDRGVCGSAQGPG